MRILVTPSFARRAKRLHANQKKSLDKAIEKAKAASAAGSVTIEAIKKKYNVTNEVEKLLTNG